VTVRMREGRPVRTRAPALLQGEAVQDLMRKAIDLAAGTRPHPNPRVGALVVGSDGKIMGHGAHHGPGLPHAEVLALGEAGDARGATVITTLEPCAHHGRTPPCTDALIKAGVAKVVIGAIDPDSKVAGRGVAALRGAGIEVINVLSEEAKALDPGYFHHRRSGRARVTLKMASTLDGQTAAVDGTSQWLTGPESRADAHRLRAASDAVIVGAGTVIRDDPRLDVRLDGYDGPQPQAVVIAGQRPIPPDAIVFQRKSLVYSPRSLELPVEVVVLGNDDGVDLGAVLVDLGARGMLDVLVEGGAGLAGRLWELGLVDRGVFYLGAKVAGGVGRAMFDRAFGSLPAATVVDVTGVALSGGDVRVEFEVI